MAELYKRLVEYENSDYYPFHMPGHKRNPESAEGILAGAYGIDLTEIDGFDNLHQAEGILKREQKRAAALYGAEKTYFLVNGSTCGILSAVSAVCGRGGRVLMARNCHKSVYHGAYLQELKITYLYPELWGKCKAAGEVKPESVERALKQLPDVEAVIITSPTYEGVVSDVKKIADIAHKYGKPLIVDEAHGGHFGFQKDYPENSIKLGADLVIHSLHKTLPSMTQTALLHVSGHLVDRGKLERFLRIFQTSSPSYVLMASMESCLDILEREGTERLARLKYIRDRMLEKVRENHFIRIEEKEGTDPCKVIIYAEKGILAGQDLYQILKEKYHLQMEMAAGRYTLAILSMMDTQEGIERLEKALLEMDQWVKATDISKEKDGWIPPVIDGRNETVMSIFEAYESGQESVELREGCGRIAAEFINLYPPGIPLAAPGERLNEEIIGELLSYERMGIQIQGIERGCIRVIKDA